MEAIVYDEYGSPDDVLQIRETDKPVVGDDEVLVQVRAASLNPYDWHFVTGLPYLSRVQYGLHKPKAEVPGADLAGRVDAVGRNVTRFRPGDEVYGVSGKRGACAECVSVPEAGIGLKPANLTFEQAAAVPMAGLTALQGLRDKGRIRPGQKVLVNGASGGVGTFAVQLARSFGADVTGVCSTRNVDLVRSIGADRVVDYTEEDFTRGVRRYDLMFDLVGNHSPSACRRALNSEAVYVASYGQPEHLWLGPMAQLARMMFLSPFVSQKMVTFVQKSDPEGLGFMKDLIEAGEVTPVIDRTYPLRETPEAMRYLGEGHARGKVAITV